MRSFKIQQAWARIGRACLIAAIFPTVQASPLDALGALDEARMWVFADGTPQAVPLADVSMTVFSAEGAHQVRLDSASAAPDGEVEERHARIGDGFSSGQGQWDIALGYRRETLDFNIRHVSGFPNIVSELDWDTDMAEIRLSGDWLADNGFVATGDFSYAHGFSGEVRDSDYLADDRQDEFSRSYSKSRGSTATRFSLGMGWRFRPFSGLQLTPLLGYAYQRQNLRATRGRQHTDTIDGYHGPFSGQETHFKPRWHGPWLGLRLEAQATGKLAFRLSAKRQWFDYRAFANWNLRDDLAHPVSFRQEGDSRGWLWEAGASWRLSPDSALTFTLDQSRQRLKNGAQQFFAADGQSPTANLNRVQWDSWSAVLGYRKNF